MAPTTSAQWNESTPGQISTSSFVAIGANTVPYVDTALRLSIPPGPAGAPCSPSAPEIYRCFMLAFGTSTSQWWGFKLDSNSDLHLARQSNGGWKDGVTFFRDGSVSFSGAVDVLGGISALKVNTVNSNGLGLEVVDLAPYTNGVRLDMKGNSEILVGNTHVGHMGIPLVRSNSASSPLYLNIFQNTDVVVGDTNNPNTGLRVEGTGQSTFRGSVGIGTTTPNPAYRLEVVGDANFSGTVTGGNIQAKYQDLAEWVPSSTPLPPGTVVVLDVARSNYVIASSRSYDTSVAGVVSARPGITLGEAGASKALIATTGRVLVRVDASRRPISIGDLLVTSDKPGMAMKSVPIQIQDVFLHRPGTVIGKALQSLESGQGEILALLSLQ